jgi:hypothetical protein
VFPHSHRLLTTVRGFWIIPILDFALRISPSLLNPKP